MGSYQMGTFSYNGLYRTLGLRMREALGGASGCKGLGIWVRLQ